ncbi:MAG: ATP-binding protein [Clostridia bacterium]|nr:ATP-binding protein [Clostridia bacterium]
MAKRKLTGRKKKQIEYAIAKNKQKDKHKMSAQDSIPFQRMYPDGICRIDETTYSKTVRFSDINYQLNTNEDKSAIFDGWCDFLNYLDSSISFQLSFINRPTNRDSAVQSISIPLQGDAFDSIRAEYTDMLRSQLSKGKNGLIKAKYLTFSIEASGIKAAKPRLEQIASEILNNFKRLGVSAEVLDGHERLEIMHGLFHMEDEEPFAFSWDWLVPSGLSPKDFIAPSSFEFRNGRYFSMGKTLGAVSFLQILAPELNDRLLADFLDMESGLAVTMHVRSVDQTTAIRTIKRKITDLDRSKIEEQKKAVRGGYDMDVLPSDLVTYGTEAKKLLQDLQSRNERMFLLTFLVLNTADTGQSSDSLRELENNVFQAGSIAQKYNCLLTRLDFQQEEGLMSSLPIGLNQVDIRRGLTTSSTAIFIPFTTQELYQNGKEALYCGLNALSGNIIMVDRKQLKNPNGIILGTPGSGKSFSAKREIANVFLVTDDDIIICDPEAEYGTLVERLHGQVIHISPTSTDYVNPMDLNLNYSDDESPLSLKSDFILSLCELIVGGKEGLLPVEKTIIDRCVRLIYREYLNDPVPEKMPILGDLYDELRRQEEKEAQYIATALEIYVTGSLNVFNHRTSINIDNRVVSFDIKELGKQLKKIGMLIVQDAVWNRVTVNRDAKKSTRYYADEFHLLLKEEQTASYMVEIWKRFRKWGGIPTGITQNVKDLLASKEIENILENSDYIYMLNQAAGDRQILAQKLNISPHQLSYVTHSGEGEGLLFYGSTILPFVDRFPHDTELYRLMTTRPNETNTIEREETTT